MLISTILAVIVFFKFSNGIETCDGGYCFNYDGKSKGLVDAHLYCHDQNKYLLEIRNQEFQSLVTKTITNWFSANKANFVSSQTWLNAYQDQGNYYWKSSYEIITYFNWGNNQPMIGSIAIKLICSTTDCKWVGTSSISTLGVVICYNEDSSTIVTSSPQQPKSTQTTISNIIQTIQLPSNSPSSLFSTSTSRLAFNSSLNPTLNSSTSSIYDLSFFNPYTSTTPKENSNVESEANNYLQIGIIIPIVVVIVVVIIFIVILIVLWKKGKLNCLKSKPTSTTSAPTTPGNESVWNQQHNENNTYDHLKSVDENNHTYDKLNNNININNNNNNINKNNSNNNNTNNHSNININDNNNNNNDSTYDHLQKVDVDDSNTYDKLNKMK